MNSILFKRLSLLFFGLLIFGNSFAQVIIYEENWETGNSWNLNTNSFWIGSNPNGDNQWIVNNEYTGINIPGVGVFADTDPQIPPILNNPNSNYLHTISDSLFQSPGLQNTSYSDFVFTNNFETITAEMTNGVSTLGLTDINVDFWWLCGFEDPNFAGFGGGQLWYSTDGGIIWNPVFPANLNSSSWTQENVTNPLFENVADLRFAFSFTNALGLTANGVGFAIDDFTITSTGPCAINLGPDLSLCQNDSVTYDFSLLNNTLFTWSDGNTSQQNTFSQSGTYWLEVNDTIVGCSFSDTVLITQSQEIILDSLVTSETSSCGAFDGDIQIYVTGGTPPYNYSIDGGANFVPINSFTGLSAGSYDVVIQDSLGCQSSLGFANINDPSQINIDSLIINEMDCNENGSIEIFATGSGNPLSYSIDGGLTISNSNEFYNLGEGSYDLEVREGLCVEIVGNYVFTDPTIFIDSLNTIDVSCNDLAQGEIEIFVSGGDVGVYNYSIDGGETTFNSSLFSDLNSGVYDILVDDGVCEDSSSVFISEPAALISDAFVLGGNNNIGISCAGDSTGALYVQVLGGTEPYTFNWLDDSMVSFGAINEDTIYGVSEGTYFIETIDANGCVILDDITILANDPLISSIVTDSTLCFGSADGSAIVSASGGVAPYTYQWSNGDDTPASSNLTAGTVWVLIQDVYGCDLYDTAYVDEPYLLEVNAIANPVTCHNYDDGELTAAPFNGTTPYNYLWTYPGYGVVGTTQTLIGMQPSTHSSYSVLVTDANGCTATDSAFIAEPNPLDVFVTQNTLPAYCVGLDYGLNTGFATVQTIGGNPDVNGNYNYVWAAEPTLSFPGTWDNFLDDQSSISGVNPGYYSVVSTDYKGCVDTVQVTIPLVETMDVIITSEDNVCFQGASGEATAFGFGGCGQFDPFDCDYVFNWTTPTGVLTFYGENAMISDLAEGTYGVTVTDANGCSITESVYIDEPDEIVFSMIATDQSCYGAVDGNDGSIYVDIQGGLNPSYTLDWYEYTGVFPGVQLGTQLVTENFLIDNLLAGDYNIEVSDTNGCVGVVDFSSQETNPVEIEQGYQVQVEINSDPSVLDLILDCYNIDDGEAEVLSPDANLSYVWYLNNNPVDTGVSTQSLSDGNVTVAAYYGNWLCETVSLPVTLQDPPQIVIDPAVTITPESCVNANDGSIVFPNLYNDIIGGVPFGSWTNPYVLNWDPISSANPGNFTLQNLSPGTYTLSVGDANGCVYPIDFLIEPAAPLSVNIENPNSNNYNSFWIDCNGANTGDANAVVEGGQPGYTYIWSNSFGGPNNPNLAAGTYSLTVTDANGCQETTTVELTEPQPLLLESSNVVNISCNGSNDGEVTLNAIGGVPNYSISGTNNVPPGSFITFNGLNPGNNNMTVTDDNGCLFTLPVNINEPALLQLTTNTSIYGSFEVSCYNENDGVITASVTGGTPDANGNFDYLLGGDGNNFLQNDSPVDFENLSIGTYNVIVTDANGCTDVSNGIVLTQPDEITAEFTTNYLVAQPTPFVLDFQDLSEPTLLNATSAPSAVITSWMVNGVDEVFNSGNFDNTQSFTFYSMGEHEVTIVATNNNGICSEEYSEYFTVQGLVENNVFSPNGDNINDLFSFENYGMLEMYVTFYNRWGDKVYEMFTPTDSWDGVSMNGQEVPEGVYFYVLNGKGEDGSVYEEKGSVTIYR